MKKLFILIVFAWLAPMSGPALADHLDVNCEDGQANCERKRTLGPLKTLEFRGYCKPKRTISGCTSHDNNGDQIKTTRPNGQNCSTQGHSKLTCTITWVDGGCDLGYYSCSCTNWATTKSYEAKVTVRCD